MCAIDAKRADVNAVVLILKLSVAVTHYIRRSRRHKQRDEETGDENEIAQLWRH